MPPTMSAAVASRRLYGAPWPLTYSVLYVIPFVVFLVLNLHWTSRGIEQPAAFCAGTTAEYRNGFGSNYSFDACHGSDICDGTNWAIVQANAEASGVYSAILLTLAILILLGNIVLVAKKHVAGLSTSWKVLAVMPLFYFPMPFINAAVAAPAQGLRTTANEFYEMAAKDKVCGNNLAALKDLDLGVWIGKPGDVDCNLCMDGDFECTADLKWIGAPAPTPWHFGQPSWWEKIANWMLLKNSWGFNPCWRMSPKAVEYNQAIIWYVPFAWFILWLDQHRRLVRNIYYFKEELVKSQRRVQPLTALTAAAAAAANAAAPPPRRTVVRQAPQPQTFWPPALRVGSVSPSAPVPPAFICPITLAPMANPAITPRGTSYDRKALCDWITKENRYPGGEGPGILELDQIAPNYALRMLMEAWIAAHAATGTTVTDTD